MKKPLIAVFILYALAALSITACGAATPEGRPVPVETEVLQTEAPTLPPPTEAVEETPVETQSPETETPTQDLCYGIVEKELPLAPVPSMAIRQEYLGEGAYVDVLGRLNEPGWYYVRMLTSTGWVQDPWVRLTDEDCDPPIIEVTRATNLEGAVILNDTFRDPQGWHVVGEPNNKPDRIPNSTKNFAMHADGYFARTALITDVMTDLSSFALATSFTRQNAGDQGYIGIRYGDKESYIEVRVLGGDCSIDVETSGGFSENQKTPLGNNRCRDELDDYLLVIWDGTGKLQVGVNSMDLYNFDLGDSYPQRGNLEIILEGARAQFDFIAITAP
ncbi:MAG: hypothetical protein Kow002_13790 [Anaerolineales bacterium]